jgi:hypothetical protein
MGRGLVSGKYSRDLIGYGSLGERGERRANR